MVTTSTVALVVASTLFLALVRSRANWRKRTKGFPLPPSRKGWPVIGNVLDLPGIIGTEWEAYEQWGKELGSDMIYINGVAKSIVVLNSRELAVDLFEKQSSIFSSRETLRMLDLMGWDWALPFLPYGEPWRSRRRLFHQYLRPSDKKMHAERAIDFLKPMLNSLLSEPTQIQHRAKQAISGIMFSLAYGIDITKETKYEDICEAAIRPVVYASFPGRYLVEFIPQLNRVPAWMPGAGFQKDAAKWRALQDVFKIAPFQETVKRSKEDDHVSSFVSLALSDLPNDQTRATEHRIRVRDAAAMVYAAGSETTNSVLEFLFYALLSRPEVQKKAQRELDDVLMETTQDGGVRIRLPDIEDFGDMPYINAIVKEALRWQPVMPVGVPHLSTADHIYKGYFIPKSTIVIGNAWAMLRDPRVYDDPETFKPERFLKADGSLNPDVPDPHNVAFGFGRRLCPGKHIGSNSITFVVSSVLLLFDVYKEVDDSGKEIMPEMEVISGLARGLKPFKCVLKPRSGVTKSFLESL
ncbi:cytochrome P450 [Coprinopsis cinerea AmutBmut pab1-1]|nr:cytochrome P450 [Coprinopsis cinerea AmutBmut pab1-1]